MRLVDAHAICAKGVLPWPGPISVASGPVQLLVYTNAQTLGHLCDLEALSLHWPVLRKNLAALG